MMMGIMPETVRVVVETGNTLPGMPEFVVEKVGLKGSETKFEHWKKKAERSEENHNKVGVSTFILLLPVAGQHDRDGKRMDVDKRVPSAQPSLRQHV